MLFTCYKRSVMIVYYQKNQYICVNETLTKVQKMFEKARKLSKFEKGKLVLQGVNASNWDNIYVSEQFDTDNIWGVSFSGIVYLGSGIKIHNVGARIDNTIVHDGVTIENVGAIILSEDINFGIGVKVSAVNENSGRAVALHPSLNAQSAYIIAMHRAKTELIDKYEQLVSETTYQKFNVIGQGCKLFGCGTLEGVHLAPGTIVEGAMLLKNGSTLDSCKIGYGVIIQDFMCQKGAVIENAAQLRRCFVGECVHIDYGFTAVDSLFFANSDMANGECCSVFAGPYTVSHHKSSLLIAGIFSFFNAGSGSNQSNHLFKTGAVHQAVHERGCKYGSNAYIMAPALTGAYNTVLSRHSSHHDTSDFPFSYLLEEQGKSILMPGAGLKSSGTERDIEKWAKRDKREGEKHDLIHFDKWNPYIGAKLLKAINISEKMLEKESPFYNHGRVKISSAMLRRGLTLYRMALSATLAYLLEHATEPKSEGADTWIDMAGMYAPKGVVDSLQMLTLAQFNDELKQIYLNYPSYAYAWALSVVGKDADLDQIIAQGKQDEQTLKSYALSDAKQDANAVTQTGYGMDENDAELKLKDFNIVRGL